jgi:hypothetical protein
LGVQTPGYYCAMRSKVLGYSCALSQNADL